MLPTFNRAEVINEQEVKPFLDRLHPGGEGDVAREFSHRRVLQTNGHSELLRGCNLQRMISDPAIPNNNLEIST